MQESKTQVFRKNALKRLYRQPLPLWVSKIKGRGFYVVRNKCVVKGIVGDVVVSSRKVRQSEYGKFFGDFNFKQYRNELVVKVVLYASPYDVVKEDYFIKHTENDPRHQEYRWMDDYLGSKGAIGLFGIDELFKTKPEALDALKEMEE